MIKSSRYGRLLIFINSTMLMATLIEIYYLKTGTFHYIVNCANVLPFKLATTSEKPQQPHQHEESTREDSEKFHVDTPVCKIPRTAIFPEYFQNNWNWMQKRMPDCSNEKQLFILSANETVSSICELKIACSMLNQNILLSCYRELDAIFDVSRTVEVHSVGDTTRSKGRPQFSVSATIKLPPGNSP